MNPHERLDIYCERAGPELYAEPLNALTNLAFFYWAWRLWKAGGSAAPRRTVRWLALLIALVGAGSFVFHTVATRWASVLDIAFIAVFNVSYLVLFLRQVAAWPWHWALAAGAAFVALDRTAARHIPADQFNGSGLYLPAVLVLIALVAYAWRIAPAAARGMTAAGVVFAVSLFARTVDQAVCHLWPWGTHFLWHLLNAWVLYRLGLALAEARAAPLPRDRA